MRTRSATSLVTLVAGIVLLAFALVRLRGLAWIELGCACLATSMALIAFPVVARSAMQRVLDVMIALLGGWTIVASRAFGGDPLRWLAFAGGAGLAGLALASVAVSELLASREHALLRELAHSEERGGELGPARDGREDGRPLRWERAVR